MSLHDPALMTVHESHADVLMVTLGDDRLATPALA